MPSYTKVALNRRALAIKAMAIFESAETRKAGLLDVEIELEVGRRGAHDLVAFGQELRRQATGSIFQHPPPLTRSDARPHRRGPYKNEGLAGAI